MLRMRRGRRRSHRRSRVRNSATARFRCAVPCGLSSLLRTMKAFVPTARSRIKRLPKRAHYDRESVYAILDAGFVCHIGYAIGRQPYVTPTAYWREGDSVYWHGSSKSRMLLAQEKSPEICLTVTLLDALVVARSGFHKSVNYRSAMLYGKPYKI